MNRPSRVTAAAALLVIACTDVLAAPAYDRIGTVLTQGILLRCAAVFATVAAVALLQFSGPAARWLGLLASATVGAPLLLPRPVITGVPDAYWHPTTVTAAAATAVAVTATVHLVHRDQARRRHTALVENLGAYVIDRLTPEERAAVDTHLVTCQRCREEVEFLTPAAAILGRVPVTLFASLDDEPDPAHRIPFPREERPGFHRPGQDTSPDDSVPGKPA